MCRTQVVKDELAKLRKMELTGIIVEARPNTFCEIKLGDLTGFGFSRCHWRDKFNVAFGVEIARGRALLNLAENIVSRDCVPATTRYIVSLDKWIHAESPTEAALIAVQEIVTNMVLTVSGGGDVVNIDLHKLARDANGDQGEFLYEQVQRE